MTLVVLPDVDGAVRDWLRELALDGLAGNVFLGTPKSEPDTWVRVQRIAGAPDETVALDVAQVQIDVFGKSRIVTSAIAATIAAHVRALTRVAVSGGFLRDGRVLSGPLFEPDDQRAIARYRLDIEVLLTP